MPRVAAASLLSATLLLAGCTSDTWLVAPAGPLAADIARLAWVFGGLGVLIWISALGFLTGAVWRGRRRREPATDDATTRVQAGAVIIATGASLFLLLGLAVLDYATLRGLTPDAAEADTVMIEVTGHQWWWELVYYPDDPLRRFATANELHVPAGRPVLLRLRSADVIHSFWVPRLQGKRDLIPGYQNSLWIQADETGVYRGSCAEFCGIQHGKMHLLVVADPPEEYAEWEAAQRAPAVTPVDPLAREGARVFVSHRCALCHTIRGTPARGGVAPDLTHLASRLTLAAASIPNTRGHLGGWIVDPQHVKPGVRMPQNPLEGEDLQALLAYLESLE